MMVLWYKILMRNLSISQLIDELAHWNKRFSSLYQCLLLPETKNRKSNFMLILWSFYILMRNSSISQPIDELAHWNKRFSSLYQCLLLPETKNRKSNFMLILWSFYDGFMIQDFDAKFEHISAHRWASPLK